MACARSLCCSTAMHTSKHEQSATDDKTHACSSQRRGQNIAGTQETDFAEQSLHTVILCLGLSALTERHCRAFCISAVTSCRQARQRGRGGSQSWAICCSLSAHAEARVWPLSNGFAVHAAAPLERLFLHAPRQCRVEMCQTDPLITPARVAYKPTSTWVPPLHIPAVHRLDTPCNTIID